MSVRSSVASSIPGQIQGSIEMKHDCTHLIEEVLVSASSVHRLKVDGFSVTQSTISNNLDCCMKSRCKIGGHDFEIQFLARPYRVTDEYWVSLVLVYLGAPCDDGVAAHLSCRLQDQSSDLLPIPPQHSLPLAAIDAMPRSVAYNFKRPLDRAPPIYLVKGKVRDDVQVPAGHHINGGYSSFTVECVIEMSSRRREPTSDLQQHLGEILQNQSGVDVTFIVSGESISAHKIILAARSPIFKAEFFGDMLERGSQCVEIQDMHPAVFKAMLHYIYTDKVPELDNNSNKQSTAEIDEKTGMAQHLLVAADRYGLDRLKAICEERLLDISIGTVASTLALAEQHNFTKLKAKCIDFITGRSSKDLKAVLETEGNRHLEASNPSVLTELLKAAHGKKRKQSN